MLYKGAFGLFRVLLGLALLGSIFWQVADRIRVDRFRPLEYFSFFSIDSSIFAGFVVLFSGLWLLQGKTETERQNVLRLVATVSMIIVGVVYHALLGDSAVAPEDIGYEWPRIPNLYLISIKGAKPKLRKALWVVVYPLTWLFLSIIRGLADGWWPYWFINPGSEGGVAGMITYILLIAAGFISLGFIVLGVRLTAIKLLGSS
ncbi:MAG: hypothetical protein EBW72_00605 [Actinobacteria bacterium]|nr:hypothetical protein [Actinomycetota bacterium]